MKPNTCSECPEFITKFSESQQHHYYGCEILSNRDIYQGYLPRNIGSSNPNLEGYFSPHLERYAYCPKED